MQTTTTEPFPFVISPDVRERAAELKARLAEGESMTLQNIADAIGLPFEFMSVAIALTYVLRSGQGVTIDPAPAPQAH